MSVLSLTTFQKGTAPHSEVLPAFLALRFDSPPPLELLNALTPKVMQWGPLLWLFDLSYCQRFWTAAAHKHGLQPLHWLEKQLQASGQNFCGVAASHPWQALLLLNSRQSSSHNPQELIYFAGPFGQTLFAALPWSSWFSSLNELAEHCAASPRARFVLSRVHSQLLTMQRAMRRLDQSGPFALRQIPYLAIKRRFGAFLADVWQWTFAEQPPACADFPWQAWQPPTAITVHRHLEEACDSWQQCAGYLQEDLDRLCAQPGWGTGERVTALRWQLTLYHLQTLQVDIRFRHPHALHLEKGEHSTCLAQAEFAFTAALQDLAAREEDLDLPANIPIIGWQLEVSERLSMPSWLQALFPEDVGATTTCAQDERLLALENKLPIPLERYDLCPNFDPLAAYDNTPQTAWPAASRGLWKVAGLYRPLFIYQQPHLLPASCYSSRRQFLERTLATPWWQKAQQTGLARDYYLLIDHHATAHWVFYDGQGSWYEHGIFS